MIYKIDLEKVLWCKPKQKINLLAIYYGMSLMSLQVVFLRSQRNTIKLLIERRKNQSLHLNRIILKHHLRKSHQKKKKQKMKQSRNPLMKSKSKFRLSKLNQLKNNPKNNKKSLSLLLFKRKIIAKMKITKLLRYLLRLKKK